MGRTATKKCNFCTDERHAKTSSPKHLLTIGGGKRTLSYIDLVAF